MLNHITDQHAGHSEIFPECCHGELEEERSWIKKDSVPYQLLEPIINSNYLLNDIEKLSPLYQTYGLEVFHSVILSFAPKLLHFFYWSMTARTYLAAIHYNKNSQNVQAHTKEGVARYVQVYPKKAEVTVLSLSQLKRNHHITMLILRWIGCLKGKEMLNRMHVPSEIHRT